VVSDVLRGAVASYMAPVVVVLTAVVLDPDIAGIVETVPLAGEPVLRNVEIAGVLAAVGLPCPEGVNHAFAFRAFVGPDRNVFQLVEVAHRHVVVLPLVVGEIGTFDTLPETLVIVGELFGIRRVRA